MFRNCVAHVCEVGLCSDLTLYLKFELPQPAASPFLHRSRISIQCLTPTSPSEQSVRQSMAESTTWPMYVAAASVDLDPSFSTLSACSQSSHGVTCNSWSP